MENIALIDFCGTVVDFQTADEFVNFTRRKYKCIRMRLYEKLHSLLVKLGIIARLTKKFPKASINKRVILWQLRGVSKDRLEESAKEYYEHIVKPHFIIPVIEEMERLKNRGYRLIIVSGGYDIYLKYFASEFGIKDILSTKIGYCGERCTGRMKGNDCLWEEKIIQLEKLIDKEDVGHSVAFSDSESDLPMMQWADEAYVVCSKSHQPEWASENGFKMIFRAE